MTTATMEASDAENQAYKVVGLIQECVQLIRSVNEFAPGASASLDTVQLDQRFTELFPKIRQCCGLKEGTGESEPTEQRFRIVQQVLWPLFACLSECYAMLDKLQTPPPPQGNSRQSKPPPPPGLLSIQNYTDVAVLIEFLVCSSILPLLQQDVLLSAQDRARYSLPKSLAGRIPRKALLWGCAIQNATTSNDLNVSKAILELRTTVLVISQVVILDRFRPMLLPRHVVDLYAAMFQADAMEQEWKKQAQLSTTETSSLIPLHYNTVIESLLPGDSTSSTTLVDTFSQARAYQTLLSRGTSAPLWLRQRVSTLLNELACRDMSAIVHAFVFSAGDKMTSASLRVARALTSNSSSRKEYVAGLCRQLVLLLDVPIKHEMGASLDQNHQSGVLTVWAVVDQLPLELLLDLFFPLLTENLVPSTANEDTDSQEPSSIHRAVRRIGILLSSLPPSYNAWKIGRLLLTPIPVEALESEQNAFGTNVTVLSQLLRLAVMDSAVVWNVKNNAVFALRCAIQALIQSSFPSTGARGEGLVPSEEVATLALLYSLVPTSLDIQGYRYTLSAECDGTSGVIQAVTLEKQKDGSVLDVADLANDMERMSMIIVDKVLLPLANATAVDIVGQDGEATSNDDPSRLPSTLFQLLLLCYFSTAASSNEESKTTHESLPSVFQGMSVYTQLATMTILPLICDKCSPESLLLTNCGGEGVLFMMSLILDCSCSIYGASLDDNEHIAESSVNKRTANYNLFSQSSSLLAETLSLRGDGDARDEDFDLPTDETLVSITSIVLTLLVTMLEMGSQRRSDEEESILSSMLPSLGNLARFRERLTRADKVPLQFPTELAEISAHAMALIAARSQIDQLMPEADAHDRQRQQSLADSIREAERDLESEQPPIRARGVAMLTRISHKYLQKKEEQLCKLPPITVIEENDDDGEKDDNDLDLLLAEIVRVSINALSDKESYVYLAAIQSLVAAADVSPREVIPVVGNAISSGKMYSGNGKDDKSLSVEQRIKLTEALLFTIRRRGKAVNEFVPLLMNLFLHGVVEEGDRTAASEADQFLIQEKTHRYFVQGNAESQRRDEVFASSTREEQDLRVKTGGPVFQSEENDVLRAGCIAVLSELVFATNPSVVARFCSSLLHFATNSLNLELSRPVRRATAMLCYELYEAMLREQDQDDAGLSSTSLVVQMVSSGEEELHSALKRCLEAKGATGSALYDPATVEHCKEALDARDEAKRCGVIAGATLFVLSSEREKSNRTAEVIRARLNEGGESGDGDVVTGVKRMKLNENTLSFD